MPAYSFAYGVLGENRTHRTTLLRRIRLPVASQGHMVEEVRFELTTSCLQNTPSSHWRTPQYWINLYQLFIIYYIINYWFCQRFDNQIFVVGQRGADPPSSCSSNTRSDRLSYWPIFWWEEQDSNLQHTGLILNGCMYRIYVTFLSCCSTNWAIFPY